MLDATVKSDDVRAVAMETVHGRQILPGIPFGSVDQIFTPAYWQQRCAEGQAAGHGYFSRSGGTLVEELGFCILGGFGIAMEMNEAAFVRLREHGIFSEDRRVSESDVRQLLLEPLLVKGQKRRYRFPNQKATRLASAIRHIASERLDGLSDIAFRDVIASLPGVGLKTASWVARNWRRSDEVAILDIHILRAGWYIGLFELDIIMPRDYIRLERRFLDFARVLGSRASVLDAVMWDDMRAGGSRLVRPYVPR
jgi:N-glycosylase/DNA lyase